MYTPRADAATTHAALGVSTVERALHPLQLMDPAERKDDEAVEELSRDLARMLGRADPQERAQLREYATELMRNATEGEPTPPQPNRQTKKGALLGVGLLMLAIGLGLMLLLPPVGAVIAILGSVMVFVGGTGTIVKAVSTVVRRFRQPSEAPAEERE